MKPQDFLLSARDFFAVLIPGSVLIFVLVVFADSLGEAPRWLTNASEKFRALPDVVQAFGYGVAGYSLGQAVSGVSSLLDWPVDWLERHSGGRLARSALLRRLDPEMRLWCFRCLASKLKERATRELLYPGLSGTAAPGVATASEDDSMQLWSVRSFWRDYLRLNKSDAVAELDRLESTQKMFRSFGIVALVTAALLAPTLHAAALTLTALSFLICYYFFAKFRLEFFYRLYKLAILTTLPDDLLKRVREPFFASIPDTLAETGRRR